MNKLNKGEYFGSHYQKLALPDLTITDTEYTHAKVDWHYHENPYFTYLLQGKLYEANKKEDYCLASGGLLFHNWQDAHYNIKPPEYTRGFHIEMNADWFKKHDLTPFNFEGSLQLKDPFIKGLMNGIFLETKTNDGFSPLSIELLILDIFNKMRKERDFSVMKLPIWVKRMQEIILEDTENTLSLSFLSGQLNIHPVHLSREFHKYFGTTLGAYIRQQKINKAVLLMATKKMSMTEIGYQCGFYDQSHFISAFKRAFKRTPSKFLKQITKS